MTLEEMIETNPLIASIYANIRENGRWLQSYHIGSMEGEDRYAVNEPRWVVVQKELNLRRNGSDFVGVIKSAIPKKLLGLEVTHWRIDNNAYGYSHNNGLYQYDRLNVDLKGAQADVAQVHVEESTDGQMTIEDFMKGAQE